MYLADFKRNIFIENKQDNPMKNWCILLILVGLVASPTLAANIHGTIYDFELNKINKVIIEINTQPTQKYLSADGSFNLEVPMGDYILTAKQMNSNLATKENLTIIENGNYSYDLFLIPDIELNDEILADLEYTTTMEEDVSALNTYSFWLIFSAIILVIIIITSFIILKRKEKPEENEDLASKFLVVTKKNGGRITQKELRKEFPYSEAKISLVITELEHKGKIEKIKKGRSNIIILKK